MSSQSLDGRTVFVSGGTGTIGQRVVMECLTEGAKVIVYSRDQNKQFKMNYDFGSKRVTFKNGDICDLSLLERAMQGADYVVHCAASKHVPLCEQNTDSAIKVNVEGTRNMLEACKRNGVEKFLLLSTDKAVNPTSVMGVTKFLAERLTLEFNSVFPCSVVRLGNVFGSNGSVVPTFLDRIKNGLPLIVNSEIATRYFISPRDIGEFIVRKLKEMNGNEIFIKKMKVMTIMQLATAMKPRDDYEIRIGKLTPGEKVKETLITQDEAIHAWDEGDHIVVSKDIEGQKLCDHSVEFFKPEEIRNMLRGL